MGEGRFLLNFDTKRSIQLRFAAIDIGSNAVRLLFQNIYPGYDNGTTVFQKEALMRVPLRLGEEAFIDGKLSDWRTEKLVHTMKGFRHLIDVYDVVNYRACATSSFRSISNGEEIAERIREEANIDVEIISGEEEAEIVFSTGISEELSTNKSYLYVDVGGGSTDISLIKDNEYEASRSFDIGTLRLLNDLVPEEEWASMKQWLAQLKKKYPKMEAIGSGGNINKMGKMYNKKNDRYLSFTIIKAINSHLNRYTILERIRELGLKPDRADVILPACEIFMNTMKWAGIKNIYIPRIGLADGLIKRLYAQHVKDRNDRYKTAVR